MEHVRQESWECMLATAAMLTGVPYQTLREEARNCFGMPWSHVVCIADDSVRVDAYQWLAGYMPSILDTLGWLLGFVDRDHPVHVYAIPAIMGRDGGGGPEPVDPHSPPTVNGSVIVRGFEGNHIVAYDGATGLIHDPERDTPEPWGDFVRRQAVAGSTRHMAFFPGP